MNWPAVIDAMYPSDDPPLHDIEPVVAAVASAWSKFGERDFEKSDLLALEERIELDIPAFGARKQVMVIDQWWRSKEKPNWYLIADWKLRVKGMTEAWASRLEHSDQGLWYAHGLIAGGRMALDDNTSIVVAFRGISADSGDKIRVVTQVLTAQDIWEFDQQREWWERRHRLDHEGGYTRPWGRRRSGCFQFGPMYPCRFHDCKNIKVDVPVDFPIVSNSSFSMGQEYQRCPERARLLTIEKNLGKLEGVALEEGEDKEMGLAFHRGIACCYEQVKESLCQRSRC